MDLPPQPPAFQLPSRIDRWAQTSSVPHSIFPGPVLLEERVDKGRQHATSSCRSHNISIITEIQLSSGAMSHLNMDRQEHAESWYQFTLAPTSKATARIIIYNPCALLSILLHNFSRKLNSKRLDTPQSMFPFQAVFCNSYGNGTSLTFWGL